MTDPKRGQFGSKTAWHRDQRRLSPRDKVRIVIELQHREASVNRVRETLGRPVTAMTPWKTTA